MIFDTIQNKDHYKDNALLYQALTYLEHLTPKTFPETTHVLIPDVLFCNPVTLTSKPEDQCIYEAHRTYIDLHYIIEGVEGIATAQVSSLSVTTPYDSEQDVGFFDGNEDGRYYLKPGQFMVCWPTDAHKVAMMQDAPSHIRKIVCKIKY